MQKTVFYTKFITLVGIWGEFARWYYATMYNIPGNIPVIQRRNYQSIYRYDEWISPDRILGKSSKLSKKKGFGVKEFQKSKLPPKPIGKQFVRSQSKRGTKSPSPASPGGNSNPSDTKPPHTNGNKPSPRSSPPLQQIDSPTSANPAAKNGTCTRRTRSDRNSFSSNGTDEGQFWNTCAVYNIGLMGVLTV